MQKKINKPYDRYVLDSVEIDNPINESKIVVPAFKIKDDEPFEFKDTPASSFSIQTLLDAGVQPKECTVVSSSFLRETEKFMASIEK